MQDVVKTNKNSAVTLNKISNFVRLGTLSKPFIILLSEAMEKKFRLRITISDDGTGIPDEIKTRLFESLVTSKGSGHSGMGLSIVHKVIKALDGTIIFMSVSFSDN